jgi:hypothetical protein
VITQHFRVFSLPELLPEGHVLVVNMHSYSLSTFVVSQLSAEPHGLVAQEVLTEHEMYVLIALLESYPHYCPYEILLAAITDETMNNARATVYQATEYNTLNQSMKPIRNLLSRCRAKLHTFDIDILSLHGEGYILAPMR